MLPAAVREFGASNVVIVDNTFDRKLVKTRRYYDALRDAGVTLVDPLAMLSYAQVLEFVFRWAEAHGVGIATYSHADAVLAPGAGAAGLRALDAMCGTSWGAFMFDYDRYAAWNVTSCVAVGVDPYIPMYRSDVDFYGRLIVSGGRRGSWRGESGARVCVCLCVCLCVCWRAWMRVDMFHVLRFCVSPASASCDVISL